MRFSFTSTIGKTTLMAALLRNTSGQSCLYNMTEGLRLSVDDTKTSMLIEFEENCGLNCVSSQSPFQTISTRKYTNFDQLNTPVNFYDQYAQSCQASGSSLCLVTSTQTIDVPGNPLLDIPDTKVVIKDVDKPICYPNSCNEEQFGEIGGYDKQCQLALTAGETCLVTDAVATCPEGRITTGNSAMCASENPGPFTQVQLGKNALYALMDVQCADSASNVGPNQGRFCDVENVPSIISRDFAYTDLIETSASFMNFREDCAFSGGSVCAVSFDLKFSPFAETASLVSFEYDYTDYPICLPKSCTSDDLLVSEYLKEEFAGTDVPGISLCDPSTGTCDLSISNTFCYPDPADETVTPVEEVVEEVEEGVKESIPENGDEDEDEEESEDSEDSEEEDTDKSSAFSLNSLSRIISLASMMVLYA